METREYITASWYHTFKWGEWDPYHFIIQFLKTNVQGSPAYEDYKVLYEMFRPIPNKKKIFIPVYKNYEEAKALIKNNGFKKLENLCDHFFKRKPIEYCNDGDIVIANTILLPEFKEGYDMLAIFSYKIAYFLTENHGIGWQNTERGHSYCWEIKKSFYD